MVTDNYILIAS